MGGIVTFEEIRYELKKCDFSNEEIEMFFGNSDDNGDGVIDITESNNAVEDLDDDIDPFSGGDEDEEIPDNDEFVTNKEFDKVEKKVISMEASVSSILIKIETVLEQISKVEVKKEDLGGDGNEGEGEGNATFLHDVNETGEIVDFVPGDGSDGNATFI